MTVGIQYPEPDLLAGPGSEHRSLRIASHLRVGQHVGEIEVTRDLKRSFRSISHPLPKRLSAIIDCFLSRIFCFFSASRTTEVWHRAAVGKSHVYVGLELKHEFT